MSQACSTRLQAGLCGTPSSAVLHVTGMNWQGGKPSCLKRDPWCFNYTRALPEKEEKDANYLMIGSFLPVFVAFRLAFIQDTLLGGQRYTPSWGEVCPFKGGEPSFPKQQLKQRALPTWVDFIIYFA